MNSVERTERNGRMATFQLMVGLAQNDGVQVAKDDVFVAKPSLKLRPRCFAFRRGNSATPLLTQKRRPNLGQSQFGSGQRLASQVLVEKLAVLFRCQQLDDNARVQIHITSRDRPGLSG